MRSVVDTQVESFQMRFDREEDRRERGKGKWLKNGKTEHGENEKPSRKEDNHIRFDDLNGLQVTNEQKAIAREKVANIKDAQICSQIASAVALAIDELSISDGLSGYYVQEVVTRPFSSTKLVIVQQGSAETDATPDQVQQLLTSRSSAIRAVVTMDISRKRSPHLEFVVLSRDTVKSDV